MTKQEEEIIRAGIQAGKKPDEIRQALIRFNTGLGPVVKSGETPQPSFLEQVGGVTTGIGKGLVESAVGTARLAQTAGQGVIAAVDPTRTFEQVRQVTGIPQLQGRDAEMIDELLQAKTPEERTGKIVAFAGELLAGGSGFLRRGIDKVGQVLLPASRKTAQTIEEGVETVSTYASGRLPKLLGIFTGESDDVVRAALRNPKLADEGIERGDDALRIAVQQGAENSVKIRNTFVQAHKIAKAQILGQYTKILIPKPSIIGIFNDLLKNNGVKILKDGTLDFTTSKIVANPGEVGKIKAAYDALKQWDAFTIDSLDDYKQLVGKLTRFADEAGIPSKSPFLGRLYNELNTIAAKKLPKEVAEQYLALNKKFSETIEFYDDVVDAFNSGDPFTKIANALGKNKDTLRQVLEFYEKQGGQDVLPIVAGRELAMEKTAAFGFLNPRSWIDLLISPKTQAKITTRVGKKLQDTIK